MKRKIEEEYAEKKKEANGRRRIRAVNKREAKKRKINDEWISRIKKK